MTIIYSNKAARMLFENDNRMSNHVGTNMAIAGDVEFYEGQQIQTTSAAEIRRAVEKNNITSVLLSNGVCMPLLGVGRCGRGCAWSTSAIR
jgi:hypothetical protein